MGMPEFYGPLDDQESVATDTADMYGPFINEELVGNAIQGRRERVVLATKFGIMRTADPPARSINGTPSYVKACCDASLRCLKTYRAVSAMLSRAVPIRYEVLVNGVSAGRGQAQFTPAT